MTFLCECCNTESRGDKHNINNNIIIFFKNKFDIILTEYKDEKKLVLCEICYSPYHKKAIRSIKDLQVCYTLDEIVILFIIIRNLIESFYIQKQPQKEIKI